jgi:hypothetical protein
MNRTFRQRNRSVQHRVREIGPSADQHLAKRAGDRRAFTFSPID